MFLKELLGISIGVIIFAFSLFMILFYNAHYIVLLLLLEMILLGLLFFFVTSYFLGLGLLGAFVFLLIMVCIGGFSIALLVSVSRLTGRDF
jgi:hypothetical protein